MSWVAFAFSGPVLWAISVHLDKYLVERFFKDSNVAVMLLFTAFVGLNLFQSGFTNWCPMMTFLRKLGVSS